MKERRNKVDEVSWIDDVDDEDDFLDLSETCSGPVPESALDMHLKASLHEPHEPEPEYEDDIESFDDLTMDEWAQQFEFDFDEFVERKLLDFLNLDLQEAREKEVE